MRRLYTLLALVCTTLHPAMADDAAKLNVSIAIFDPGIPEDASVHRELDVFPRIRNIEAMFLPFVIREALVDADEWGAVRVVPEPDPSAELLVQGRIVHSDGATLTVHILARDATGRTWIDQPYSGDVSADYAVDDGGNPADQVRPNQRIVDDLLRAGETLTEKDKLTIAEVSLLRYGNEVAPAAFGGFFAAGPDGELAVSRLPALDDPMIQRIALVRSTEYVITDAVDAKFRELNSEIASVYDVWREFRRRTVQYAKEDARRAAATLDDGALGSYESIRNAYDNYRYHRITEEEQDRLAVAFFTEVGPRIEAMESRVAEMQTWVDAKYAEWRRILEEFFELETG